MDKFILVERYDLNELNWPCCRFVCVAKVLCDLVRHGAGKGDSILVQFPLGYSLEKIQMFGNAIQSGILDVQLGGKGVGRDWRKWIVKGWVALTDGVVSLPGRQESVDNLFVRLRVDRDFLDLKRMEFRINDSEAVVTGFINHWNSSPQVSVMWDAPRFDIDLLLPKKERTPLRDGIEWLANHGKLKGSILIKDPIYKALYWEKFICGCKHP